MRGKRLAAIAASLLLLAVTAPGASATASPGAVSHDCMSSDTTTSGLRVVVCVDGYIYEHGTNPIFAIKVEYICADRYSQIRCAGVKGLGQEYVSPYGWVGAPHRFACGVYAATACSSGRNYDQSIDSIALPANQSHHWVGRAWNVTILNGGTTFLVTDYRGLDYTTVPDR